MKEKGIASFSAESGEYDENARLNKGNRDLHKQLLTDVLSYISFRPHAFFDLGCGTAFFSDVFYEMFPGIQGTLLDGSEHMLSIATKKLVGKGYPASFIHSTFEALNWSTIAKQDVFFSSLAVHHLPDHDKWTLFRHVYEKLNDQGLFILFDLFLNQNKQKDALLEYLACRDIQRRLQREVEEELGEELKIELEELKIENIIQKDRLNKYREGDKEALLEDQIAKLYEVGFDSVVVVFQDIRFACIVASKKAF